MHPATPGFKNTIQSKTQNFKIPEFTAKTNQVQYVSDYSEALNITKKIQQLCEYNNKTRFPGSYPISIDLSNINLLKEKNYMVTWKSDGIRYLMYIVNKDNVYMLNSNNHLFRVQNLLFPKNGDLSKHVCNTLLDGEFVYEMDDQTGERVPKYLIYDIIHFEELKIGKLRFKDRLACIENEIIIPRSKAIGNLLINQKNEPFGIQLKSFFPLFEVRQLRSTEFMAKLKHNTDGLIFQPIDEPYISGPCFTMLKWKPSNLNTIDFKLRIFKENSSQMNRKYVEKGKLLVGKEERVFGEIEINKELRKLNGKIIECKWENNEWKFLRRRVDRNYPNSHKTADSVWESIKNPVTEELLFQTIDRIHFSYLMSLCQIKVFNFDF